MKKHLLIHIPLAIAFCALTACSSDNGVSAPSEMCWDEVITYKEATTRHLTAEFMKVNQCDNVNVDCNELTMKHHVCVDNVEFK